MRCSAHRSHTIPPLTRKSLAAWSSPHMYRIDCESYMQAPRKYTVQSNVLWARKLGRVGWGNLSNHAVWRSDMSLGASCWDYRTTGRGEQIGIQPWMRRPIWWRCRVTLEGGPLGWAWRLGVSPDRSPRIYPSQKCSFHPLWRHPW